jgi:hypothetical protein
LRKLKTGIDSQIEIERSHHLFFEVRVVGGITGWENLGPAAVETIVWSCLAFSVFSADIVLLIQELRCSRPSAARMNAAFEPPSTQRESAKYAEKPWMA